MPTYHDHDLLTSELRALIDVARALAARLELPELLQSVMDKIIEVLEPAEFGLVFLWNPAEELLRSQAACAESLTNLHLLHDIGLRAGESVTGKVFLSQQAILLGKSAEVATAMADMRPVNREIVSKIYGRKTLPQSIIAAPVSLSEHNYGALVLETLRGPAFFSESDVPFVQALADLIALEIDRARLDVEAVAIRESHEANRLRTEVLATLSHEMRTPLAAIKGYSTALLLEEVVWPEEKRREFLQLIDQECDNLEGMVGEMLDSSLIDVGQLEIELQPVRLSHLAREIADEMQRHTNTHQIIVDFPLEFPIVDADPRRMKQVMRNILDNALKYSPHGGLVVIRGEIRAADVVISIADQGVGISPEDLIPLFDKYFRVKAPTGYHVPGTGLGLPVSRTIVEAHGGRIWAESKVGEGTTLFFSIPVIPAFNSEAARI